ncbi:uncharacterized protein LOC131029887 isoform X2 [Cryptomeria japonica]|nr:uncharacterized protein LOC131029887 isoform X2 [Cryptomeria japonica]
MVEHKSLVYHLPDSIFVETVFHGSNGMRYLLAEVSGSDFCNAQEYKILSGKDGNLGMLAKTENGEFDRHFDKKSNGTSLDVHNGKSKKKKKLKLVTEGLHVKEGHDKNNVGYTDLVAAIDGKVVANDEFGKDPTNPDSGDKITDSKGGRKRKKREKQLDLNEDLAECILSPCKEKSKREQVTAKIENIVHCSSEWKNIEMDKNSPVGHLTVSEKVRTLDSLNDNGTQNVLMAVEKCEQKNLNGNTHTNAGNEHVTVKELCTARKHETSKKLSTERKHETSSKIFNEQNSLNETEKNSNVLQRKTDDSTEFNTEKKIKFKRKRSSKTVVEDDQGIFCNDVSDPCQITKHGHLQEFGNGKTEEDSARECDIVKKSKREIKMVSKHGLGNNDHDLSSKRVDDEPQLISHTHFLEYKCCKPEEVVGKCPGASNVSDTNGLTNNVMSETVKYLDASNDTENHQPCIITKKKKMKHSRNDMTWVDVQERITTEKVPKNDITVNSSKDERDVNMLDAGNKNRRDIHYENGSVRYAHHSKNNACRDLEHITEPIQIPTMMNNEQCNAEEVKSSKKIPSKINRHRTTKVVEREMDEVVAKGSHSEQKAGDLEHVPETLGATPPENDQKCNDKEIKSSKKNSSKVCQEKTFNIEKRGIEEGVIKSPGAPIVSDNNGQANNDMNGSVKYLDVSNNTENHQLCNITRKRKTKHSRNDMTLVDAQEKITTEKVKKDDIIVNSSKSERDVSILDVGNENRRDTPGENGRVKYPNVRHSKNNAATDLEHVTETKGTTSMGNNEDWNTEKVKSSKNSPSKIIQDRTTKVVERGMDEVVAKGSNSKKNARDKEKKQKDIHFSSETSPFCRKKAADSGFKSKSSAVPEGSNTNQSLKDRHANSAVVKNDQKIKGSADVDCKVEKTTIPQFDTNNTNYSLRPDEDTGIRGHKFQSTAQDCSQKLAQKDKLDANDLSYVKKSPKENQGDVHFTEKIQPVNKDVASPKTITESCGYNLKKTESSSTAGTTQSSEKNEDIDCITNNDRSQGAHGHYDRKDNSVSCHSQKKIANDAYIDSQHAGEEYGIDGNPVKLQLVGKTHDGVVMNRPIGINTISPQIKTAKKTKVDNHSKKNHISLFRSSSDVSTEGDNGINSYMGSSSSKGSATDSSDSYDSDAGSRDNISKIQSIKPQKDWEPSTSGALLSTAVGKKKDIGENGSIHSKFVHLLAKKTGLGELFKIARNQQKPESQHFGGDFMADDSPTVDMVLETQESQMDPVLYASNNRESISSPIEQMKQRKMVKH